MRLTCIECKNEVDLTKYSNIEIGNVVECNHCGITLEIRKVGEDGTLEGEIVEEGK